MIKKNLAYHAKIYIKNAQQQLSWTLESDEYKSRHSFCDNENIKEKVFYKINLVNIDSVLSIFVFTVPSVELFWLSYGENMGKPGISWKPGDIYKQVVNGI